MSIVPLITFKAGACEYNDEQRDDNKVKPLPAQGYIYLYSDDDLIHFCWRKRSAPMTEPDLDLVMVPTDGQFVPYTWADQSSAKTNGRIFVLKFASSSSRHFFWLQSKPQSRNGDPSWFSPRDKKIGEIVNRLLQGEEVSATQELGQVRNVDDRRDNDDDETMEDVEGHGGAGHGATGGDIREEGEDAREGGSDGARAAAGGARTAPASDADAAVQNFLRSLQGNAGLGSSSRSGGQQAADKPYPYLNHLLPNETTIPMLASASEAFTDNLLGFLPPTVLVLATGAGDAGDVEPSAEAAAAARASLRLAEKKNLLQKVLRSPQFHQALGSLTMALRDGGLPTIAEALNVKVANGGYIRGGGMPLGGGEAVEAFVEGVKTTVKEEEEQRRQ
ncbi:hypothetical protein SODALDRAFT_334459 [Sodiomyces alkalinus F11]|uniref:Pru domain-containing protein n=1 Tax=Sodiomyces alkalinus (strain CBS 110278 / VKM F-3762 / F11) TaxID=1314773 RepID=A0A3N2PSR4_SODAK|nr:hypothetical protein SODALDRAFT_334459 [Sodiomyces alkalinus F11]ROT37366.1 hypothetical protein SODALDRAFT_334459 [Sodiomyces alkalinus F11]